MLTLIYFFAGCTLAGGYAHWPPWAKALFAWVFPCHWIAYLYLRGLFSCREGLLNNPYLIWPIGGAICLLNFLTGC